MVLMCGEAGIGKTRLVEELSQHVRQRGDWVACGHCYEYERALPHGPLADLLRAVLSATDARFLGRLLPWQVAELVRLAPELSERFPSLPSLP
jgi:predicted ATPase